MESNKSRGFSYDTLKDKMDGCFFREGNCWVINCLLVALFRNHFAQKNGLEFEKISGKVYVSLVTFYRDCSIHLGQQMSMDMTALSRIIHLLYEGLDGVY